MRGKNVVDLRSTPQRRDHRVVIVGRRKDHWNPTFVRTGGGLAGDSHHTLHGPIRRWSVPRVKDDRGRIEKVGQQSLWVLRKHFECLDAFDHDFDIGEQR